MRKIKKIYKYAPVGYTLFAPLYSKNTYLINGTGQVTHRWEGEHPPANVGYLLNNGNLLRTGSPGIYSNKYIRSTATGFYVQEILKDGKIVWDFKFSNNKYRLHHDIEPLPNGNVLMLVYEKKTAREAIAAGRNPALLKTGFLLSECVIEVKPKGLKQGEIVWRWHLWDHLVQDYNASKNNFGKINEHTELIDINFTINDKPDWVHLNAIDYNEHLDQILLTSRTLSEIWVIDHSTSKKEAAGHMGGKSNRGGDIIYRWGNPQVYGRGTKKDQRLFGPHDAQWIKEGFPGGGNILIFNNGDGRPKGKYSSIEEIVPSLNRQGVYAISSGGKSYGPKVLTWQLSGKGKFRFYSQHISGAERLDNGNTLVCVGGRGYFFEIDPKGKLVWEYQNNFCDPMIYKKKTAEAANYTFRKIKNAREKEAVFKIRRYPYF